MNRVRLFPIIRVSAACIAFAVTGFTLAQDNEFETPPTFSAEELVPTELISGKYHTLQTPVEVVDYSYLFKVDTPFGHLHTWGSVEELATLVREIEAIATLREIEQTEVFAKSFEKALETPVVAAWNAATHPVQTVTGLPGGVSRYILGTIYSVKRVTEVVIDKAKETHSNSGKNKQNSVSVGQRATAITIEVGKDFLGYYTAMRQWAERLNVDPYSYNIALQESLGRIAWASTVGSLAGDYVMPSGGAIGRIEMGINVVWEKNPIEIERENVVALRKIGVRRKWIRAFNKHKYYSLTEKTQVMITLREMAGTMGRPEVFKLMLESTDQRSSLFLVKNLSIIEQYNRLVAPIKRVEVVEGMIAGYTVEGRMILPVAVEYLHWTSLVKSHAAAEQFNVEDKELWISGVASNVAQEHYIKLGWKLQQKCMDRFIVH